MEFKVQREYEDHWIILHNGNEVATIQRGSTWGVGSSKKTLIVNGKDVCNVANQKEALKKLEEFFAKNKSDIEDLEILISLVKEDTKKVKASHSMQVLMKEVENLNKKLETLKSYDLV